ncbi:MAG: hypothetical protein GY865_03625 [candidate division Zixibacteria bacterium]|nr:hypothetical protein [candidate division Zixibacteria bacterium]
MSSKKEKLKVKEILIQRDLEGFQNWAENARNPQRALLSLAYDSDELVVRRAIEAIGKVASMWDKSGTQKARNLVRQQFWMMSDESGGLGWHSPEIIGEILVNVPKLINKYAPLLPSYFDEEPFERGSYLAVYRVASINPKPFVDITNELIKSLNNPDDYIKAYALMSLAEIDLSLIKNNEDKYSNETGNIELYDFKSGQFVSTDLGDVFKKVMDNNNSSKSTA